MSTDESTTISAGAVTQRGERACQLVQAGYRWAAKGWGPPKTRRAAIRILRRRASQPVVRPGPPRPDPQTWSVGPRCLNRASPLEIELLDPEALGHSPYSSEASPSVQRRTHSVRDRPPVFEGPGVYHCTLHDDATPAEGGLLLSGRRYRSRRDISLTGKVDETITPSSTLRKTIRLVVVPVRPASFATHGGDWWSTTSRSYAFWNPPAPASSRG